MKDTILKIIDVIEECQKERNIVICGPRLKDEKEPSTQLRVYSYGGLIAEFGIGKTQKFTASLLEKEYLDQLEQKEKEKIEAFRGEKERVKVLLNKEYWMLASKAAQRRYSMSDSNGNVLEDKERNVESKILQKYMRREENDWIIFDMEFFSPKEGKWACIDGKPDLVCFDGERFGVIELKYNNKSCSNLKKHYKDLMTIVENPEIFSEEMARRMKVCFDSGDGAVISKEMYEKMEKSKESKVLKEVWFGFLFVGGKAEQSKNIIKDKLGELEQANGNKARYMIVDQIEDISRWQWGSYSDL